MAADIDKEVRAAIAGAARDTTAFSYALLTELGWEELFADDPHTAVGTLFEEQGRLLLTGPALDAIVLAELRGPWSWGQTRVLYPAPGRRAVTADGDVIEGVTLDDVDGSITTVLAPLDTGSGPVLHAIDAAACKSVPVGGLDESAGLFKVSAPRIAAEAVGAATPWAGAVRVARRALAHQLIGVSRTLLRIAVMHVSVREQFGRPLGANQAVQHRLADAQVDLAAAEELVDEAWHTESDLAAAVAKGQADRALESIGTHGQQVLGAIGYTWEHAWRHPLRRGMFLSAFLGSADECEREVGELLLASGVARIGAINGEPS